MASNDHVSDSETSEVDLLRPPSRDDADREPSLPESDLHHGLQELPHESMDEHNKKARSVTAEDKIAVMVPAPSRPWEYEPYRGDTTVDTVLEEFKKPGGEIWYKIEYEDGRKEDVSMLYLSSFSQPIICVLRLKTICIRACLLYCPGLAMKDTRHLTT
jgi:hypothetical protein